MNAIKASQNSIGSALIKLIVCFFALISGTVFAQVTTNIWTGVAGGNTLNTAGNWSPSGPPGAGNLGLWDGTVQTNNVYLVSGNFGGSGNTAASFEVQGGYTNPLTIYGGSQVSFSNIVIDAGAGPFTFGSNGVTFSTVFRSAATNQLINNSTNVATIAQNVQFNSSGGGGKAIVFGGSGSWVINSPWNLAGSGGIALQLSGTGNNTLTLTTNANAASSTDRANDTTIFAGTLILANGDALGVTGPHNLNINGVVGQGTLALTNNITLNGAVANINIQGRNGTTMPGDAAIYNQGGNSTINGNVIFSQSGGTNVSIYTPSGNLTLNGALTSGNLNTSIRYFNFFGAGTNIVNGVVSNGPNTTVVSLVQSGGVLALNNANTYTGNTVINNGVLVIGNNLALQSSLVQVNGGTLALNGGNGFSPYVAGLSGAGTVDSLSGGNPTLFVGSNNVSSVFNGNITNSQAGSSVSLQKVGAGTFVLAGASGYSGGTTVAQGTLLVSNTVGSATGTGNISVSSGTTFGGNGSVAGSVNWQSGASAFFTLTPAVGGGSNSTPLTVAGSLTLNGNAVTVNLPGGTIAPGTYILSTYNNTGSSGSFAGTPTFVPTQYGLTTAITTSGGQVRLVVGLAGVAATWTNDVDGTWTTVADWSSNPSYPHTPGDSATLGVGSAFRTITLNANASVGAVFFTNANSFQVANAGNTLTLDNGGSGVASIVVNAGSSNLIGSPVTLNTNLTITTAAGTALAFTNTVGGAKTISLTGSGVVAMSGNNTYGTAAGTVGTVLGGGVLGLGNNNAMGAGDLGVSSSATVRANNTLILPNNILVNPGATATLDNNGNNVTLSGVISGGGALAKNSAGTLVLNNANTFTNGIAINAGTVQLGNASAIPSGAGYGNVNMATNAVLNLNGYGSVVLNGLNSSDASAVVNSGGTVALTLGESGANGSYLGTLNNGSGSLVKDGTGTQTLGGTNIYSGGTTINGGTLQIGNGQTNLTGSGMAVGVGSGPVVDNGVLQFNLAGTNIFTNSISGSGGVNLNNTGLFNLTGNNTFTGGITNNGGSLLVNQSTKLGAGPKTIQSTLRPSQILLDGSAGNLSLDSSYSFVLSGDNGVLVNVAGSNTLSGNISIVSGAGNPIFLANNGFLNLEGQVSTVAGNLARTLILGGAANGMISGTITEASGVATSVTKSDAGTWTLSGGNSYSGSTVVSNGTLIISGLDTLNGTKSVYGGTLLLNGTDYGTGSYTVASNATFGGTGGVVIYPGTVTWQAGAVGLFTTSTGGSTPLAVYGNVTLNNNPITVYVAGGTPLSPGSYTLMTENNILSSFNGAFASTPTITGAGVAPKTKYYVTTTATAVVLTVVNSSVWTHDGNGNWTTGANWDSNPSYPNTAGQVATLGVGSALTSINLDVDQTIGGIYFTNNNSFIITNAANMLTLDNSGNIAAINVTGGSSNSIVTSLSLNDGNSTAVTLASGTALSIPGNVAGSSPLILTGGGTLSLSGANSYTATTTLSGPTLVLGNTNALGSGTFTINSGSLDSAVPGLTNANNNAQNWNGNFVFKGSQSLNLGVGSVAMGTNLTVTVSSNKLVVGGLIGGAFTLTYGSTNVVNNGVLELDGASSFSGLTLVSGTVALGNDNALGAAAQIQLSPAVLTPAAATNLTIMSKDSTARTITNGMSVNGFDGPYMLGGAGTGDLIFSGVIATGNGQKRFYVNNKTTFSGLVTDGGAPSGAVIKDGPGVLILSASNYLTKPFQINAGTLALGSTNAIGSGLLTINGGGLDSTVANLTNANNNAQTWAGSFYFAGSQNLNLGAGNVTLATNSIITVSNNTLNVGGAINGPGYSLAKAGAGTLVLAGTNTYGNTTVIAGTLEIAQAALATNSTVSISNSAVLQLDFNTTNQVAALVLGGTNQAAGVYKAANAGGYIAGAGSLLVVPQGPTGPAQITSSVSGSTLSLSWPAGQGWKLQMQTNSLNAGLGTNWIYITDGSISSTNITIDATKPAVFYRLTYP